MSKAARRMKAYARSPNKLAARAQTVPARGPRGERGSVTLFSTVDVGGSPPVVPHGVTFHAADGTVLRVHWPWYVRLWRWLRKRR